MSTPTYVYESKKTKEYSSSGFLFSFVIFICFMLCCVMLCYVMLKKCEIRKIRQCLNEGYQSLQEEDSNHQYKVFFVFQCSMLRWILLDVLDLQYNKHIFYITR